jgi:hypothetical protein
MLEVLESQGHDVVEKSAFDGVFLSQGVERRKGVG